MNVAAQVAWAESQVGQAFPDKVNPYIAWQTDGLWSAAEFCDAGAQEAAVEQGGFAWQDGCQFGPKGDAYVPWTITHAQELGIWHDASEAPQVGWQPIFDWNRNGSADHIGACVTEVLSATSWIGVEFNAGGGSVKYVWRDDTYLMGWVGLVDDMPPPPPPPPPPEVSPGVEPIDFSAFDPPLPWYARKSAMMFGPFIALHQLFLIQQCGQQLDDGADGWYGEQTRAAVVNYQRFFGLQIDGVVGEETATSMRDIATVTGWAPFPA